MKQKYKINCNIYDCGWESEFSLLDYNEFSGICPLCGEEKIRIKTILVNDEILNKKGEGDCII